MMWNNAGQYMRDTEAFATMPVPLPGKSVESNVTVEQSPNDIEPVAIATYAKLPIAPCALTITRRGADYGIEAARCFFLQTSPHKKDAVYEPRRIEHLQALWKEYVKKVFDVSEAKMWRVFCSVRTETRVVQTAVLRAVRHTVDPLFLHRWPRSRRALDLMISKCGGFRTRIIRSQRITLSDIAVKFQFVDPIYAWTSTASRVSEFAELYFNSKKYFNEAGERLYGRSVQSGDVLDKV